MKRGGVQGRKHRVQGVSGFNKMRGTRGHAHGLDAQENKQGLEEVIGRFVRIVYTLLKDTMGLNCKLFSTRESENS